MIRLENISTIEFLTRMQREGILEDRRRLVNAISNYTTLSELEQGVVKKRTLNRFIVK